MSFIPALISAIGGGGAAAGTAAAAGGTLATLGNVAAVVGAVGSIAQGQAANQQAKFQASVTEQQAARERVISAQEEEDFRRTQSATLGERRAAAGASGVEIGTGSPLAAFGDFAAETELQARRIREGGGIRAKRLNQQAELTRRAGRSAATRGLFRGGALLLTGFSKFGPKTQPLNKAVGTDLFISNP